MVSSKIHFKIVVVPEMALQLEHILPSPVKNQDIMSVHSVLMLNKGTNFEVHDGWKSNLEPVQKEFFQS